MKLVNNKTGSIDSFFRGDGMIGLGYGFNRV